MCALLWRLCYGFRRQQIKARKTRAGDGRFAMIDVRPGTYTLRITLEGFENFTQTNTVLKAGDALVVESRGGSRRSFHTTA